MIAIREETRALMSQWRRSMSTRAALAGTAAKHVAPQTAQVAAQQRHHLVTATVSAPSSGFPAALLHGNAAAQATPLVSFPEAARAAAAAVVEEQAHSLVRCAPVNGGRQVVLEFGDRSQYEIHSRWLKDSSPTNKGADFYRKTAADVWKLREYTVVGVEPALAGEQLSVTYEANGATVSEVFEARWLHALAPFVGKALHKDGGAAAAPPVKGTSSLFHSLHKDRKPWRSDVEMPTFDAAALGENVDEQVKFLESMVDPGIALVTGVGVPTSLERELCGRPMEDLVLKIIGRLNQHPVRSTRYGVMRKTAESAKQGADYDMSNPLSMHTDHSVYQGTPGYLQFLYQAQGSVRSKVCDGLALAEYVREHHPEDYRLLTTVNVTHSSRNTLYTAEGAPRSVYDKSTQPAPFELVHTHPIVELDEDGLVEKVVQSETKRGVCALPFDTYDRFMQAYELWTELCEDPRFIKNFDWPEGTMVVTNNWRTLHGRASVPPNMARSMVFGYVNKILVENRYRYLKQVQTQRQHPNLDADWLTRLPNQVLAHLTVP